MNVRDLLLHLVEQQGSDLHLKAGSSPYIRVDGELVGTPFPRLAEADTERSLST